MKNLNTQSRGMELIYNPPKNRLTLKCGAVILIEEEGKAAELAMCAIDITRNSTAYENIKKTASPEEIHKSEDIVHRIHMIEKAHLVDC